MEGVRVYLQDILMRSLGVHMSLLIQTLSGHYHCFKVAVFLVLLYIGVQTSCNSTGHTRVISLPYQCLYSRLTAGKQGHLLALRLDEVVSKKFSVLAEPYLEIAVLCNNQ